VTILKHVDEGRAESLAWHPPLLVTDYYCRQQQRQQEQDVVIAIPDVLYASSKIIQELLPRARAAQLEGLLSGLGTEDGRGRRASCLQAKESLVLRIDAGE
jgi:hypothetical protein